MSDNGDGAEAQYHVVLNHEEQYSIWPVGREIPAGWRQEGTTGTKEDCLAHIDVVWTDMRPLSLRRHMEQLEVQPRPEGEPAPVEVDQEQESLVSRLSAGDHPVEVSLRPDRTASALREAIDRGYVFVRFTATRGTTELGVELDAAASDTSGADFDRASGSVRLVGDLVLDFEPVRCTADIDLETLSGRGRLTVREPSA